MCLGVVLYNAAVYWMKKNLLDQQYLANEDGIFAGFYGAFCTPKWQRQKNKKLRRFGHLGAKHDRLLLFSC
jgi:hypothetical protein